MFIPLLAALIPSLVSVAEKIITKPDSGSEKKEMVQVVLEKVYDRFLADKIPDFPGIDERAMFIELSNHLIDLSVEKLFNKKDG